MLGLSAAAILATLAVIGFFFAYNIYLKPWKKTWWEVVVGSLLTISGETSLILLTLWYFNLLGQLWFMAFIPITCYAVTGLSQIYWQEEKVKEGRKRASRLATKYNGTIDLEEDE